VTIKKGQLRMLRTSADLPLRGRVPVVWEWSWKNPEHPQLKMQVDGEVFFRARGSWRKLSDDESQQRWRVTPGADPVQVPGEHWPARINMQRVDVADGVYLVRGVRTGFQHLVVDTAEGLVVADAPAGWVELHQIPPADLVPGLGISGLSERFIDFLAAEFPGRPIRAVALTHAHDDHAGGARAFAAAGAAVYAPAEDVPFLKTAFNRDTMPHDRFSDANEDVEVIPVSTAVTLDDARYPVRLLSIGTSPHGSAALGVHAAGAGYFFVSDLHVPNSEADTPRVERAAMECWFARWAVLNLPPATVVLNSHSALQTPVSRLENYLQSASCRALDD
jgi:glyoxylase-like metal-dependent hydrolase (beta-lactamase superfamily II)